MKRLTIRALTLALPAFLAAGSVAGAQTGDSSWSSLEQVRGILARAGATEAQFEQTFVAAGFSSGDSERAWASSSLSESDMTAPSRRPRHFTPPSERLHRAR